MIVDISLIRVEGLVIQGHFKCLDAPLIFLEGVICEPQAIHYLWICLINLKCCVQVFNRICKKLQIVITLSSIHKELSILLIPVNSFVEEWQSLVIVTQSMIAATLTVVYPWVFFLASVKIKTSLKVFNCFKISPAFQLRNPASIEGFSITRLNLDSLVEVIDSKLVISHVLID